MAYCAHGPESISPWDALRLAASYVPLCFGIKSLVRHRLLIWREIKEFLTMLQIMAIDDILDADVDGLVERTKMRPLPRGAITPERAWVFFFLQAGLGIYLAYEFLPAPVSAQFSPEICIEELTAETDEGYQCGLGQSISSILHAKYVWHDSSAESITERNNSDGQILLQFLW